MTTTIDRDGVRIAYDVTGGGAGAGDASDGAGAPVLFSHGFASSSHMFGSTVAALDGSRRCVRWDLRGHGRSDYPTDPACYSVDLSIGDMLAVLDAAGVERAVLVGHSLGGYLSLALHRRHPERVAGLALVDTGPGYRRDDARAGWNDMCEDYARSLEQRGLDGLPPGAEELRSDVHRSADGLVHAARGILRQDDAAVLDHLPSIDVPTLVLVGSRDKAFLAGASYMERKIPGARLVVVDGAGHAPMISHPSSVESALADLLARVDSAS
jgi:pimeloyl-ACP methyl ester carboxylesterase